VPVEDEEVSKEPGADVSPAAGITVKTGVKVPAVKPGGSGVVVDLAGEQLEVERVLMALGGPRSDRARPWRPSASSSKRRFVKVSPTWKPR